MKLILSNCVFLGLMLLFGCNTKDKGVLSTTTWEYPGDDYFLKKGQLRKCECGEYLENKDLDVYIKHESDVSLEKYKVRISINGTVYIGAYSERILIKDFCFCASNDNQMDGLSIQIIDKEKQLAYVWAKKETYDFSSVKEVRLNLLSKEDRYGGNMDVELIE